MQTGKIFDIKKFAIHDGPGIRTTVFFKGCPLSCRWCHNPEGISKSTQRIYRRERCIGCEECIKVCPNGAVVEKEKRLHWIATDCNFCKTCAQVCPAEAVEFIGRTLSVDEIMTEIAKDTVFYNQSHGGVTISGGEPLMQTSFLLKLLDACGEL
ncbi:MAG: glycyl-radical enzyme activating protein, partial [Desulfobacterales bacterium]|nr:glycyl-radical enzyme activating protein [Desulfobacterales bacterium]